MSAQVYLPYLTRITDIVEETADVKTFALAFLEEQVKETFTYRPGQFVEVSVFGVGEAPFGISSSPPREGRVEEIQITVRAMGSVTQALHRLSVGDLVGVRGPLGNDFLSVAGGGQGEEGLKGKRPLFVGGGIGLPPLRSLINYLLDRREKYPEITILYGARTPGDRVYKSELKEWAAKERIEFLETVDVGDETWEGNVGLVTELFDQIEIDPENTVAFVCGPPIMIHFVILRLLELKVPEEAIISTLERHMKCGVGKCGHCAIGHKYVCTDGPVFSYAQLRELQWQSGERP